MRRFTAALALASTAALIGLAATPAASLADGGTGTSGVKCCIPN